MLFPWLTPGGSSAMILLLEILGTVGCAISLGVSLWVLGEHICTIDVPPSLRCPLKFRILYFFFQLTITWGNILEKLGICSMPRFFRFIQDRVMVKRNYGVMVTDLRFGTIPARLFRPKTKSCEPRRGIIFYHGGAAMFGGLDCHHSLCSFLAQETDSVLLAVGYRKLPKYHYPVISVDCWNATIHFLNDLQSYGVDPSRVVICGESLGGGIAALIAQRLVDRPDLPRIRAQALIYPVVQAINWHLPSFHQNKNVPFLTKHLFITCVFRYLTIDLYWQDAVLAGAAIPPDFWKKYKKWLCTDNIPKRFRNNDQQPTFPAPFNEAAYLETRQLLVLENAPIIGEDEVFAQLPETFMVSCEYDILRDDALLYKKRLEDHNVPVTWFHVEDGFHGCMILFDKKALSFPCSWSIVNAVTSYIKSI